MVEKLSYYSHDLFGQKVKFEPVTFRPSSSLQTFEVPTGNRFLRIKAAGASGYGTTGGGGIVECVLKVKPKQLLYINVGNIPTVRNTPVYNAADIRTSTNVASRIIVAAGAGSQGSGTATGAGGAGGGLTGSEGVSTGCSHGGYPGTQTAAGAGGGDIPWTSQNVTAGQAGQGHMGGAAYSNSSATGGAGGAGYYGGGGGAAGQTKKAGTYGAGGAGGSSYADPSVCSEVKHTSGSNNGTAYITISMYK